VQEYGALAFDFSSTKSLSLNRLDDPVFAVWSRTIPEMNFEFSRG
jgi:hypothetical protein